MSYMQHLHASNNFDPAQFIPFILDGKQVGWILREFAHRLKREKIFLQDQERITLIPSLATFEERTEAMGEVVVNLFEEGIVPVIMNEPYPVTDETADRETPLFLIDRPAALRFGIRSFGQHVNGFVRSDDGLKMWVGKRAQDRGICPGQLDQIVAGGLPYGVTLADNLRKECYEEAGINPEMANKAIAVGAIRYQKMSQKGGKEDVLYVYDLELSEDFVPVCTDGEVEQFYLMSLEEVARIVRETEEFKLNCNLVIIDFLIRHGWLKPEEPDYQILVSGVRCPEYFVKKC